MTQLTRESPPSLARLTPLPPAPSWFRLPPAVARPANARTLDEARKALLIVENAPAVSRELREQQRLICNEIVLWIEMVERATGE